MAREGGNSLSMARTAAAIAVAFVVADGGFSALCTAYGNTAFNGPIDGGFSALCHPKKEIRQGLWLAIETPASGLNYLGTSSAS